MRFLQLIASVFLFFAFVQALPLPVPVESDALEAYDVLERRAGNNKGGSKGGGSKGGNNKGGGNSSAAKKTAKGIDKNISIQKKESKDVNKLKKDEGNTKKFNKEKGKLQGDIKAGQEQRAQNQKTAPKGNKQLNDGLKKVQGAQAKESKQAATLKGNNSKQDKATLNKLSGEFKGGRQQNEKNKQAALSGGKGGGGKGGGGKGGGGKGGGGKGGGKKGGR